MAGMVKTLELAMSKAAALPEAAQEALGREILKQIDELTELRAEIEIGIQQLDAGLGRELDLEEFLQRARAEHARKA
jgi:Arc/MetJ-type ribon-helix-helix transcriptional regulator